MSDVIWALDTRDRLIACPSKPTANAVVLYLADDGGLPRDEVERWAAAGVMIACITWPGVDVRLEEDDLLDLQDAADGLRELASVVGVVAQPGALDVVRPIFADMGLDYVGVADLDAAMAQLQEIAPV